MADNTAIEWTDATWNPITGCSIVSKGCTNCYAMKLAGTRLRNTPSRAGLTRMTNAGPVWTGEVRFNEQWLDQPLRWRRPRKIFVCAHGDLFAEAVPDEWIDRVFAVMALAREHTFQVLTKRPNRMRDHVAQLTRQEWWKARLYADDNRPALYPDWPLPNVWLGASVENQGTADERIPLLLETPAAIRFVSAEPLLGPINFRLHQIGETRLDSLFGRVQTRRRYPDGGAGDYDAARPHPSRLDQIIVGGESGPNARPMHPQWARDIRDQCQAAGTAFFFKQWGEYWPAEFIELGCDGEVWRTTANGDRSWFFDELGDKGQPEPVRFHGIGKKAAGRLLDGREWSEFPRGDR